MALYYDKETGSIKTTARIFFPEPQPTEDTRPGLEADYAAEEIKERRWAEMEADMTDFARAEADGWAAVVRCLGRAMAQQPDLFR